jgi:hypothetical protein
MLVMNRQKTTAVIVLGLSILFYIFFETCKHTPALGSTNPFAEDPYDAVGSFAIFLSFLSAIMMGLRTFRTYPNNEIPAGQRVLVLRAGAVAILSVVVTLAADAIGLGRAVITTGSFPAARSLAEILVGMSLVTLLTGWIFIRASRGVENQQVQRPWLRGGILCGSAVLILAFYPLQWRETSVAGGIISALAGMSVLFITTWGLVTVIIPVIEFGYEDVFDDVSAIIKEWGKHIQILDGTVHWIHKAIAQKPMKGILGWINPRRHRWNLAIITAAGLGLMLVLVEALSEGVPTTLERMLLVGGVYVGLGGAGVMLGYVLFGRYLGIFRLE